MSVEMTLSVVPSLSIGAEIADIRPIRLVNVEDKKTSNSQITIIATSSSKTFDYSDKVPEGYTCIGCTNPVLSYTTGGIKKCEYSSSNGSNSASVVWKNTSTSGAVKSSGIETVSGFQRFYYISKLTLVCIKNGDQHT